jgi:Fibronectin type III domain
MRGHQISLVLAVVAALAAAPSAFGVILPPLPRCTGVVTTNCMVSVFLDDSEQPYPSAVSDPYQISAVKFPPGDVQNFSFNIDVNGGGWTLPSGGVWEVTINTGASYPGETFSRGRNVTVVRGGVAGSHTVRFTLQPVRLADQGCNSMGVCVPVAARTFPGYLDGWVDDLSYITDPDDRAAMRGFDLSTNAEWVSTPLQLDYATNSIVLDASNSHFEHDGTTVFVGEAEFRIPFAMLSRLYNVDDPASLTASAFQVTAPGASASTSVTVGASDVKVELDGITFTKRRLRIHGNTTPRAPTNVRAKRTSSSTALLGFTKARPRGSKVRGYKATCRAGSHVVTASSSRNRSPLRVAGLYYGTRYACTLRAKSHAGLGKIARISISRF